MALNFIRVDFQFIDGQAVDLATELGVTKHEAIGLAVELWAWTLKRGRPEQAPDGLIKGANANKSIELAVNWAGKPDVFVNSAVKCGLIDVLEDGLRVRGTSRYLSTFNKQQLDSQRFRLKLSSKTKTNTKTNIIKTTYVRLSAIEELKNLWNALRIDPMPVWQRTGRKRAAAAQSRLKEYSLEDFRLAIIAITKSKFHLGNGNPDTNWIANPDWLLRPDSICKMLEKCTGASKQRIIKPDEDIFATHKKNDQEGTQQALGSTSDADLVPTYGDDDDIAL